MPGATVGLQKEDPTIAELLKPLGYATGQFGKNHLGDRDEFLPTVHGFDEFFGNLYHLNAEEEPELPDYPKDPAFKKQFGPRGVLHCMADGKGGQTIEDTGPLTKKRMETIDEEITDRALAWMEKQAKADKPFFLWYNSTAMHFRTHVAEKNLGKSGQDPYSDRMVVHDEQIGKMLDKLDELGIADNTIVMYSTDNGPENDTWPDGANTPFRGQKDTNWEGGWRVPCFMRWPGKIKPGSVLNGIVSHIDMFPTLLAAAGDPDVTKQAARRHTVGGKNFKVHLDGYNHDSLPHRRGEGEPAGTRIIYFSDDGEVIAVRVGDYKFNLAVQRAQHDAAVGGAVREAAGAVHHEPAPRSVRAGRLQLEHLPGLDGRSRAADVSDAGGGGAADRGLRQVPAAAEAGVVQPGRGDGAGVAPRPSRRHVDAARSERANAVASRLANSAHAMVQSHAWALLFVTRTVMKYATHEARMRAERRGGGAAPSTSGYPYPPPVDNLDELSSALGRPASAAPNYHLFWPAKPYRDDHIDPGRRLRHLAGGQARDALARGAGHRHRLQRDERALHRGAQAQVRARQSAGAPAAGRARGELETSFDQIVCTGVLHHLPDPDAGLRALRDVLEPERRDASHGLRALRPGRHLHAAGVLPAARHQRHDAGDSRSHRRAHGAAAGHPLRRCCATRRTFATRRRSPTRCCIRATAPIRSRSCSNSSSAAG